MNKQILLYSDVWAFGLRDRTPSRFRRSIRTTSEAPWNETFWRRPDFDKLLQEARSTINEAKRKELHCEMQRMISEEGGTILPTFTHTLDAGLTKVKGLIPYPLGVLGGWKAHETAWLET